MTDELRNELIRAFDERAHLRTELQGLKNVAFDLVQEHLAEIRNLERENEWLRAALQRARLLLRNAPGETARREAIAEIETALGSSPKDG